MPRPQLSIKHARLYIGRFRSGSSRFQSPVEYQLGADIDEITNVYTLGATAFALFGEYNRTREKWQLSDKLFEIATRAVSDDRANRQQTIRQFTAEWEAA